MENYKIEYTEEEREAIDATLLKGCTEFEKMQVWHLADKYGLDLMQKGQLWVSGFGNQKNIIVGRDGQLSIGHRRGGIKFFKSDPIWREDDKLHEMEPLGAYCVIERMDGGHFEVSVNFREYNKKQALWKTMPGEMITKCAEVKCLRRAFDMSGFYSPEELEQVKEETNVVKCAEIEEEEKNYPPELYTSRKEREAAKKTTEQPKSKPVEAEPVKEPPKIDANVAGIAAQIKVESPKKEETKTDDALTGSNPDNVRRFKVFCENIYDMFGYKVTEEEKKEVLETPGELEPKMKVIRDRQLNLMKEQRGA